MSTTDDPTKPVTIDYTNWRGERRKRQIVPQDRTMKFGKTEWHPIPGWLFRALDCEDGKMKWFAMSGVHGWEA